MDTGIRWTSETKYVDIDTGELITKRTKQETRQEIANKYIIIKTIKHAEISHTGATGHIEYTIKCRRDPQTRIWENY